MLSKKLEFINRYPIGSYLKWHTDEIGHKVCIIYLNPEWNGEKQGGVLEHLNEYLLTAWGQGFCSHCVYKSFLFGRHVKTLTFPAQQPLIVTWISSLG